MIATTTPNIEGKRIVRYRGVIAGEAILGANIFKDRFAGILEIVGGRSGTYERELESARHRIGRATTTRCSTVCQCRSRYRPRL